MLLISSSAVFAQIELLHSVKLEDNYCNAMNFSNTANCYSICEYYDFVPLTNISGYSGYFMYYFDKEINKIVFKTFSSNFSETEKTFPVPNIDGYVISDAGDVEMYQHVFNNDDDFEFVCEYKSTSAGYDDNDYKKLVVIDSKGNIIKDFGTAQYFAFVRYIFLVNNQATICIYKDIDNQSTFEIYSVPTTVNPNQLKSATISNPTLSAFPNPAKTFVNLSYNVSGVEDAEMVITDASGRVVERRIVNAMQDNLRLNVANYKRGMYFYEVQGFTGRFIVE